jgi:hypothetical protein
MPTLNLETLAKATEAVISDAALEDHFERSSGIENEVGDLWTFSESEKDSFKLSDGPQSETPVQSRSFRSSGQR